MAPQELTIEELEKLTDPRTRADFKPIEEKTLKSGRTGFFRQNRKTGGWEEVGRDADFGLGGVTDIGNIPNVPLSTRFKMGFATTPEQMGFLEPEIEPGAPSAARRYLGPPSQMIGHLPELIGMGGGGALGTIGLKSPTAGVALAGVGATAGKGLTQFVGEEMLGLPPASPEEGAAQRRTAFAQGAAFEALGIGANWFLRGGFLAGKITPEGRAGRQFMAENFPEEFSLTPGQVTDSAWGDIAENVAGAGFFGSRLPRHIKQTAEAVSTKFKNWIIGHADLVPADKLGVAAMEALETGYKKAKGPAIALRAEMYKDALTAGADGGQLMIPMKNLRSAYQTLRADAMGSTERGVTVLNKLERTGLLTPARTRTGQFQGQQSLELETAINLRTLLGDVWAGAKRAQNRQLQGKTSRLLMETDNAIRGSLKEAGLLQSFERQLSIFKGAESRFHTDLLKELTKRAAKAPERFIRGLAGADRVTLAKQLKKAIGGSREFGDLQRSILEDIYRKSLAETELAMVGEKLTAPFGIEGAGPAAATVLKEPPLVMGSKLADKAFGPTGYGREFLTEMGFDNKTMEFIADTANALRVQQAKGLTGAGSAAIQFTQIAAAAEVGGGLTGQNEIRFAAGAILLGPKILAKIATSPRAQRWVLNGLTTPAGTSEGIAILSGFLGEIASNPELVAAYTDEVMRGGRAAGRGVEAIGELIGMLPPPPPRSTADVGPPSAAIGQ
jgi:hypothetical protein